MSKGSATILFIGRISEKASTDCEEHDQRHELGMKHEYTPNILLSLVIVFEEFSLSEIQLFPGFASVARWSAPAAWEVPTPPADRTSQFNKFVLPVSERDSTSI
jgi:hypothetical protein